jgi:hypothetical protein
METAKASCDAFVWRTNEIRSACDGPHQIGLKSEFHGDNGLYKQQERLNLQDRLDILLENKLSGVAEQRHTIVYGKSQF